MRKRPNRMQIPFATPTETAWGLFEQTGNINYYMLYRNLMNDVEKPKK